jgi:hypothetical protein
LRAYDGTNVGNHDSQGIIPQINRRNASEADGLAFLSRDRRHAREEELFDLTERSFR